MTQKNGWALLIAVLAALASTSCDQGGGCETDLDCKGDRVCADGVCVSPAESDGDADTDSDSDGDADTDSDSDADGDADADTPCEASCDAGISACSLQESFRQPCIDDCERRAGLQPADCMDEWNEGLECQGSPSAWTCEGGQAVASGCESERLAQEQCLWNGDHCEALGGEETAMGACGIPCTDDSDCPLSILYCPGHVCYVRYDLQDEIGCGPDGWRIEDWGCELLCSEEGADSDCPDGMRCWTDSISGDYAFCGS